MIDETLLDAEEKMDKAVSVAKDDFGGIRTGRATPQMFAKIVVDYYGAMTPINQLSSLVGLTPRSESRMARSMTPSELLSYGLMTAIRGSGTVSDDSWLIGVTAP